jgi:hypothetical protein
MPENGSINVNDVLEACAELVNGLTSAHATDRKTPIPKRALPDNTHNSDSKRPEMPRAPYINRVDHAGDERPAF